MFVFVRARSTPRILILYRAMALNLSPPQYRGMTALDRDAFSISVDIIGARVRAAKTGQLLNALPLKKVILRERRLRNVVYRDGEDERIVLFNVTSEDRLDSSAREYLQNEHAEIVPWTLQLGYDYWSREQILESILPEELASDAPSSFTITGHLAHYNLRDEYLPYKNLVGQVTLDKNPHLRTIVNKLDTIDTQFRFFKMELLAGDPDYVVEAHEANCRFTFDFSCVYWNSRLHTEHERLVDLFQPNEVIADAFAGVGPFAIPAAKNKQCMVYANDLNPQSVRWLRENVQLNKVSDRVTVSERDGREFIANVFAEAWSAPMDQPKPYLTAKMKAKERHHRLPPATQASESTHDFRRIHHVVMNLPDSALTFLDAFRGVLAIPGVDRAEVESLYDDMPMVHVHCFTREMELDAARIDISNRAKESLGSELPIDAVFHLVRSVAPNKEMYCVSFRVPKEVAFAPPIDLATTP